MRLPRPLFAVLALAVFIVSLGAGGRSATALPLLQ